MLETSVVSVNDFIPANVDSSTTDCTAYIQAAIDVFAQNPGTGGLVRFEPNQTYYVAGTVYFVTNVDLDVRGCTINAVLNPVDFNDNSGISLFESGYWNGAATVSNISTGPESDRITNCTINGAGASINYAGTSFKIKNGNEGFRIVGFRNNHCGMVLDASRCFYATFDQIIARNHASFTGTDAAFKLYDFNNIIQLSNCSTSKRALGYDFDGPNSAFKIYNCGAESVDNGMRFANGGNAGPFEIDSCYFEFIPTGKAIEFTGDVHEVVSITNCWFHDTLYSVYATNVRGGRFYGNKFSQTNNNEFYDNSALDQWEIEYQSAQTVVGTLPSALSNLTAHSNQQAYQLISARHTSSSVGIAQGKNYTDRLPELVYMGDSGIPQSDNPAFCTATKTDLGSGNFKWDIDTKITYRNYSMMIGYYFRTTDNAGTYTDVGFVVGDQLCAQVSSGTPIIAISNNGGYLRFTISNLYHPTIAGSITATVRIL